MGSGQRADLANLKEKLNVPGPGNYQALDDSFTKKNAPKYGFGTSKREEIIDKKQNLTGPGAYETIAYIGNEGKKNSISPKLRDNFKEKESRNHPGPGQYEFTASTATLKAAPAYKIGTSIRHDSVTKERINIPDGTVYNPNDSFTKNKSAAFGFGTDKRKSVENKYAERIPGPGQYELRSKAFSQSRFAMGIKLKDQTK